jgi:hypothetical protein
MQLTEIDFHKSRLSKLEPLFALKQQQIEFPAGNRPKR